MQNEDLKKNKSQNLNLLKILTFFFTQEEKNGCIQFDALV